MKIRDSHARINGDEATHDMPSGGLDVIADDGRSHGGKVMDDALLIKPKAGNCCEIIRKEYEK